METSYLASNLTRHNQRFDPTYKGWKRNKKKWKMEIIEVLWSYLQGMETRSKEIQCRMFRR